jgi:hypothetical protein
MVKGKMQVVQLDLTPVIARKLAKHQNVTIKPGMVGSGVSVHLSGAKHRKLMTAKNKEKGMRLSMTPEELELSGEGFKDLLKRGAKSLVKHGAKALIKHVKEPATKKISKILEKPLGKELADKLAEKATEYGTTKLSKALDLGLHGKHLSGMDKKIHDVAPLSEQETEGGKISLKDIGRTISKGYKKYVKPIASPLIRKGLKEAVDVGSKALGTYASAYLGPEATAVTNQLASKYGDKGVDYLMKKTGLGMMTGGASYRLQSNYSNFLNSHHPAMHPTLPMPDMSLPHFMRSTKGGSFLPAGFSRGGSFLPAGKRYGSGYSSSYDQGSPMNPRLPQRDFSLPIF